MLIVKNDIIPIGKCKAMTVWPLMFVKKLVELTSRLLRHENIHGEQEKEMLFVGLVLAILGCVFGLGAWSFLFIPCFFWWYGIEWVIRSVQYMNWHEGYRNISYEREAYFFEGDEGYLKRRKHFAWICWLWKNNGSLKIEKAGL